MNKAASSLVPLSRSSAYPPTFALFGVAQTSVNLFQPSAHSATSSPLPAESRRVNDEAYPLSPSGYGLRSLSYACRQLLLQMCLAGPAAWYIMRGNYSAHR